MDFVAPFGGGEAETVTVAFEDDGAVQDVAPQGSEEECGGVGLEAGGLQRGEFVEGCEDRGRWGLLDGCV